MTVDTLIDINSIITDLNNTTPRKINVKRYRYDMDIHMDKDSIEHKLYQLTDPFNYS